MKKRLFGCILMVLIGGSFASSVIADDTLVRFKGAIGDIPVANVAGTPKPQRSIPCVFRTNTRRVNPAGRISRISQFTTDAEGNGSVRLPARSPPPGGGH